MADTSSIPKIYNHSVLQRIDAADINAISTLVSDLDREAAWALLSASSCVIDGFDVSFSSGTDFNVSQGAALYNGQVLKSTGSSQLQPPLATNSSSDPRIDVVYIAGEAKTPSDNLNKIALGPYTRTPIAGEAVGTGDDSTTAFDLGFPGVDPKTLKVQLAAIAAGGWNLSPGTGTAGVDQVIFGTAPGASVEITADYTYESGGAEAPTVVATRQTLAADVQIAQGTPAVSPSVPLTLSPNSDIILAHIYIPGSWSGGAPGDWPVAPPPVGPQNPDNAQKSFLLHPDQNVDSSSPISPTPPNANAPRAGRVSALLRNMDQLYMGGRLRCAVPAGGHPPDPIDTIELTAMWGTLAGYSIHSPDDSISLQLQTGSPISDGYVTATGWWYIYLAIQAIDVQPGTKPRLIVSQNAPNSRRRNPTTTPTPGGGDSVYVGAVYLTSISPVTIRPFYTHGQWVFWQVANANTIADGTNDVDISAQCPPMGRLCAATIHQEGIAVSVGNVRAADLNSHRVTTLQPDPYIRCNLAPTQATLLVISRNSGFVRAEQYEGARWVHAYRDAAAGEFTNDNSYFEINGYLDDYRTMDENGAIPTIY